MPLDRFLFAPVLLAVAVLTAGPRRTSSLLPPRPDASRTAVGEAAASPAPARALRLRSHPATVP